MPKFLLRSTVGTYALVQLRPWGLILGIQEFGIMPVFWSRGGIPVPNREDKAVICVPGIYRDMPRASAGQPGSPCEDTDLLCTAGLNTGPDTFDRLRSHVRGRRTGVRFCDCQKTRWVGTTLVCICVKLKQCREKSDCCAYHVCTLTVHKMCLPLSCYRICYFPRKRVNTIFPGGEAVVCWIGRDSWHVSVVALFLCALVRMPHNAGCWSKNRILMNKLQGNTTNLSLAK